MIQQKPVKYRHELKRQIADNQQMVRTSSVWDTGGTDTCSVLEIHYRYKEGL